ncbi:MAG: hypothetical protein ACTSXP_06070 [Promethearchaeota archaeon]
MELYKYLEFKNIDKTIEEKNLFNQAFENDIVKGVYGPNMKRVEDLSTYRFFQLYFNYYMLDFFGQIYLQFYQTLKKMLEFDFLYQFHPIIAKELPTILEYIEICRNGKNKFSKINVNLDYYNTEEVHFFIKSMFKHFSELSLHSGRSDPDQLLCDYLILGAIGELHDRLMEISYANPLLSNERLKRAGEYVEQFTIDGERNYQILPKHFSSLIHAQIFKQAIGAHDVDCLFLPNHDRYALVKRDYTPNLTLIDQLTKKEGGVSIAKLAKKLDISTLTSELMIQVLVRRKMVRKTYSYLHGEKFFLRE